MGDAPDAPGPGSQRAPVHETQWNRGSAGKEMVLPIEIDHPVRSLVHFSLGRNETAVEVLFGEQG